MRNHGTVAVLAMIFMAVFAVLGVALYSMATASMNGAHNDREAQVAMAAAESGMTFLQRTIGDITMTSSQSSGASAMAAIYSNLATLNGSASFGGQSIPAPANLASITSITIPEFAPHANSPQRISASLTLSSADLTADRPNITMQVTGSSQRNASYRRTLGVKLVSKDRMLEVFTFGVFAKGRVDLADGKASVIGVPASSGSIGSAYTGSTAVYHHGGDISGNVYLSGDPTQLFTTTGGSGSIGGVEITDEASLAEALTHVRQIDPPLVPTFNPNQFYQSNLAVVDTQSDLSGKTFSDICIQPPAGGTTLSIKFGGNDLLQGLIYVKPGVTIEFSGNPQIRGVIVVEDPNLDASGNPITSPPITSTSTLNLLGTPIFATPEWPNASVVSGAVQTILSDYSVLGPSAYMYLSGNSGSNHENAGFARTVVCGTLEEYGSGMVKIRDGTLITMSDTMVTGTEGYSGYFDGDGVQIQRSSTYRAPFGGFKHLFSWVIDRMSYQEVPQ